MRETNESALIARCQKGDRLAFEELIRRYMDKVYYLAYSVVKNHQDADDILQESFIRVYKSIKKFKERERFYPWLYRIVVNQAKSYLKKREQSFHYSSEERMVESAEVDERDIPVDILEEKELRQKINKAIDSLPPQQRLAIRLFEVEGLSMKETAEVLNCRVGTVKSHLHRARWALREKLKDVTKR